MTRREAPRTREGWYALHDFRRIDWDAWREAPRNESERAIEEGTAYLDRHAEPEAGASAYFSVLGHKADLLFVHLRPTIEEIHALERKFEQTALASFTERPTSYVSVTEVSGYLTDDLDDPEDTGIARYVESRLHPQIPDAEYVSFYPMSKRRGPDHNWYDLSFEDRAELMSGHGEIGREYAGQIVQIITGSIALDDFEWGVTLFADDPVHMKDLLYEMRFDPSTSRYAEFGQFYVGQRFQPGALEAVLAGEPIREGERHGERGGSAADADGSSAEGNERGASHGTDSAPGIRAELDDLDVYAGQPHGEDVHAVVVYSEAAPDALVEDVDGLRGNFDHYDNHVRTAVYVGGRTAVVSLWETERAASIAAGFLSDLPGVVARAGEEESGFGTMGMFYTVKPEYREDFVETFSEVESLLSEMDGHLETDLLANRADENDMFIASQWTEKEAALAFFRSDAFRETVEWGREVLADRPRHVFLA